MKEKDVIDRLELIRRFLVDGVDYIVSNSNVALEIVLDFAEMLEFYYNEIEDILDIYKFKNFSVKQRAYQTQKSVNNVISYCEKFVSNVAARD